MKEKNELKEGGASELKPLNVQGDIYYTTYTRKYQNRQPWAKHNLKEVVSFIPGTIREVLVKEGDSVEPEQKMLVLEAMKMMNTIYSPAKGKIKALKVKVGDCIPKGTVLLEFE